MIVVMEKGANKSQIAHMVERVETMGLKVARDLWNGTDGDCGDW